MTGPRTFDNIFWLGLKEFRSIFSDKIMLGLIVYSFTFAIYAQATGMGDSVRNASVAIVDEDRSALSRELALSFYPPYFKRADLIAVDQIDQVMDRSQYMFVISIPPDFEADLRNGEQPEIQLNVDSTAVLQAGLGAEYIQNILNDAVERFVADGGTDTSGGTTLVLRRAYNPNGTQVWFGAIVSLLNQLSLLVIVLTGAALIREREHGTIEHILVLPVTPFQIAMAKVWANGVVILVAFLASLLIVVQGVLDVPIAGSHGLLILGTVVYIFATAAIGVFLGTIARTMAQFALLMLMTIMPIMMLSGGMSPVESQPEIVQPFTWLLPSRHYMEFAKAIVFRGADFATAWPSFVTMAVLGLTFFAASLVLFRRSVTAGS